MVKVKLNQLVIGAGGTAYYAGVYDSAQLPPSIVANSRYCSALEDATPVAFKDSLVKKKIKIGEGDRQGAQQQSFQGEKTVNLKTEPTKDQVKTDKDGGTSSPPKLSVNKATADELATIDGITAATATKLVEEREKGAFKSFDDLEKRLPLTNNRKWANNFSDRINFD